MFDWRGMLLDPREIPDQGSKWFGKMYNTSVTEVVSEFLSQESLKGR